jgi:hypothetical protein
MGLEAMRMDHEGAVVARRGKPPDSTREWACDRKSHNGRLENALDEAAARGWIMVNMKSDWKKVFPFE